MFCKTHEYRDVAVGAPLALVHTSYDVFIPSHRLMLKIEELWIF